MASTKRPTRVALIRQRYNAYGGAERFTQRVLTSLAGSDLRLSVIAREWQGDDQLEFIPINPPARGRTRRDQSFHQAACQAARGFDLVQSHERLPCCDIYRAGDGVHAEWLVQRARLRGGLTPWLDRLSPYHRYTLRAERDMFASPRLKAVICNSAMVRDELRRYYDIAEQKLRVIYSGVDPTEFSPAAIAPLRAQQREQLGLCETDCLIAFVGSGFERKGAGRLLAAMAQSATSSHAVIVGHDKHGARYQQLAQDSGLAARVHFTGGINDVRPYLAAADVFCLPTLYDPFPNAVLEAMACGLPVITSFKSGAVDLIRNGNNGLLVDALDVPALANAIDKLDHPKTRQTMGEAGRTTVANLTLDNTAKAMTALYEELLSQRE